MGWFPPMGAPKGIPPKNIPKPAPNEEGER
jgi:hypothetical protein